MIALLKQPLLHFLVLGALIFLAYDLRTIDAEPDAPPPENRIVVTREALLDFMQYRASNFDPATFGARLAAMSPEEVDALVAEYVREEALYRQALSLGLDTGDYIIRQRLVQRVEFLLENLAATSPPPTEEELRQFYEANPEAYTAPPAYTFAHIFFDAQQGGAEQAERRAEAAKAASAAIDFAEADQHGDRFPFLQAYENRTRDFVLSNFSADFVQALDGLEPGESWQGPVASRYGYHLVMLRARTGPVPASFAEARARVLDDYRYERLLRSREEAEARLIADYAVEVDLGEDAGSAP